LRRACGIEVDQSARIHADFICAPNPAAGRCVYEGIRGTCAEILIRAHGNLFLTSTISAVTGERKAMKIIKRELLLCLAVSAFAFVCALTWGNPFLANISSAAAATHSQQTHSAEFKGTVLRDGEQFLLRDAAGQIYHLDDPARVQSFEDKAVSITGRLDSNTKTIHVERVEATV
jgi:hypothetical protein